MFWILVIVLVVGALEWLAVEQFLDHVHAKVRQEEYDEALGFLKQWHWLAQLDPMLHTQMHELSQQLVIAKYQQEGELEVPNAG